MYHSQKKDITFFIVITSFIVTTFSIGYFFLFFDSNENASKSVLIFSSFITFLLFISLYCVFLYGKKTIFQLKNQQRKYAEYFPRYSKILSNHLNKAASKNLEEFMISVDATLSELSNFFTDLKGVKCNLTLMVNLDNKLKTLSSTNKGTRCRELYNHPEASLNEIIASNTDLKIIFQNFNDPKKHHSIYFFSNNLPGLRNYFDSRLDEQYYLNIKKQNLLPRFQKKLMFWSVPYKSVIVIPIALKIKKEENRAFLGTIAIESNEVNVFNKEVDISLLQTFSELIFLDFNQLLERF